MPTVYGIQKSVTQESGLTYDHYGVSSIHLNPAKQSADIVFTAWKDFTARLTGKKPIIGSSVVVTMTFEQLGLGAPMTNPLEEIASAVMDYALSNSEELSGGQKVSQSI